MNGVQINSKEDVEEQRYSEGKVNEDLEDGQKVDEKVKDGSDDEKSPESANDDRVEKPIVPAEAKESGGSLSELSRSSVDTNDLINELKDMYDEESDSEEGSEEEEDESEEEDFTQFRAQLEEKYMRGVQLSPEYLEKENRKIEEVPEQLYAVEIYIEHIKSCGHTNHWLRVKLFDVPVMEIRPQDLVEAEASMYPNPPTMDSKATLLQMLRSKGPADQEEQSEVGKEEETISNLSALEKEDIRLGLEAYLLGVQDYQLPRMQNNHRNIQDYRVLFSKITGVDEKENLLVHKEPICNGKTVMFPMTPRELIHKVQREPLRLLVVSSDGRMSSSKVCLQDFIDAVVRSSKGPPHPDSLSKSFHAVAEGDFIATVTGTLKMIAFGPQCFSKINLMDNPNERDAVIQRREDSISPEKWNKDCQEKPPIITGPQKYTLYDMAKGVRADKRESQDKAEQPSRWFQVEDLTFNRSKNTVERGPKKTFYEYRSEIDRYMVLNKSKEVKPKGAEKVDKRLSQEACSEEKYSFISSVGTGGFEIFEEEEEEECSDVE